MPFVTDDEIRRNEELTQRSSLTPTPKKKHSMTATVIALIFVLLLFFVLPGAGMIVLTSRIPQKLALPEDSQVQVVDDAGVFGDASELETALKNFQDKTGITVKVYSTNKANLDAKNQTLESYAQSCYLNTAFKDKKHWVVVYLADFNDKTPVGTYQGKDTNKLLEEVYVENFKIQLRNNLYATSSESGIYFAEQAFAKTFNETATTLMKVNIPTFMIVAVAIWFVFGVSIAIFSTIHTYKRWKK